MQSDKAKKQGQSQTEIADNPSNEAEIRKVGGEEHQGTRIEGEKNKSQT